MNLHSDQAVAVIAKSFGGEQPSCLAGFSYRVYVESARSMNLNFSNLLVVSGFEYKRKGSTCTKVQYSVTSKNNIDHMNPYEIYQS